MPFPRTLRALTARLTDPVEMLDAADLAGRVHRTGCAHVATVSRGGHVTLTGRVRTVPGIDTGRCLRVTGRVGVRHGHKIMFNPRYELLDEQPRTAVEESRDRV